MLLTGIVGASALLRVPFVADRPLWLDEIGQVVAATRPTEAMLETVRSYAAGAPLDYLGTGLATALVGDLTIGPRLWPLLVGLLAIPAAFLAASEILDRRAGLLAAAAVALSPFHGIYSVEARPYALIVLLVFINFWALFRARRGAGWWPLGVTAGLMLLTSYSLAVLILAEGVQLAVERRWKGILAIAIGALVATPWWIYALPTQMSVTYYRSLPSLPETVWRSLSQIAAPGPLGGAAALLALLLSVLGLARQRAMLPIAAAGAATLVVLWITASWSGYFWNSRHVIVLLPIGIVLAAGGLAAMRRWRLLAVVAAGILLVSFRGAMADPAFRPYQDWLAASKWLGAETTGTVASPYDPAIVSYYSPSLAGRASQATGPPPEAGAFLTLADGPNAGPAGWEPHHFGERLWVFTPRPR